MKLLNALCMKYRINLRTILSVNVTNAKVHTPLEAVTRLILAS